MQTTLTLDLIATDPAVRSGQPCIAGTGLRVTDLVIAHLHGPDAVSRQSPCPANIESALNVMFAQ